MSAADVQQNLAEGQESNNLSDTYEAYKLKWESTIDKFVQELDARFTNDQLEPVFGLHKLITANRDDIASLTKHWMPKLTIYSNDVDLDKLSLEVNAFASYKATKPEIKWEKFNILRKEFINNTVEPR
jgi:hypothetical protein